jgi:hypothetical protein
MPSYFPAKRNAQYIFYVSLAPQASANTLLSNPSISVGDCKVSIDGGALNNLTTLPVVTPASSKMVKVTLSAAEMNGDNISVVMSDAAGAEWRDLVVFIATTSVQFDDIPTAATIAAAVWASGTRTLTGFGTLIADIWSHATRTLTASSGGATAAEVWSYVTRTLTGSSGGGATAADVWGYAPRTLTMTATQVQAAVSGSNLTIIKAVTFEATLTGVNLPSGWDKCYFTIKRSLSYPDSDALVQVLLSNPGAVGDGLVVMGGEAGVAANGSLVVAGDSVTISLADDATAQLAVSDGNLYDVKVLVDGASVLLTTGKVTIAGTPTATI